jgi:hypothetical protein
MHEEAALEGLLAKTAAFKRTLAAHAKKIV